MNDQIHIKYDPAHLRACLENGTIPLSYPGVDPRLLDSLEVGIRETVLRGQVFICGVAGDDWAQFTVNGAHMLAGNTDMPVPAPGQQAGLIYVGTSGGGDDDTLGTLFFICEDKSDKGDYLVFQMYLGTDAALALFQAVRVSKSGFTLINTLAAEEDYEQSLAYGTQLLSTALGYIGSEAPVFEDFEGNLLVNA